MHILIGALYFSSWMLSHSIQFLKKNVLILHITFIKPIDMELSMIVKSECKSDYNVDIDTHEKIHTPCAILGLKFSTGIDIVL